MDNKFEKKDSVWMKFGGETLSVMRAGSRANHPSRPLTYSIFASEFSNRHFTWLDVGVVGMFDYESMLELGMDFTYTGVDVSPPIIEDAKKYLRNSEDQIHEWDIQDDDLGSAPIGQNAKFDLITLRHVISHLHNYEQALKNVKKLLSPNGICVITIHIPLSESPSTILTYDGYPTDEPGTVIRHHINVQEFFDVASEELDVERFIRLTDKWKPNDVVVLRNTTSPSGEIPAAEIVHMRGLIWRVVRAMTPGILKRLLRIVRRLR
jgi:SAM-dependent methyltransferase